VCHCLAVFLTCLWKAKLKSTYEEAVIDAVKERRINMDMSQAKLARGFFVL